MVKKTTDINAVYCKNQTNHVRTRCGLDKGLLML